jgi:L-aspartate oxidase
MSIVCDFLVIGSGVAGLSFCLEAAEKGSVCLVTKRSIDESNTKYAQGGIAAVLSDEDSFEAHMKDTLVAGAMLSHDRVVELCVKGGPERIRWLEQIGARFDKAQANGNGNGHAEADHADLDLHLEGGHSARRIIHAADMTGREVERALVAAVRKHQNIRVLEEHMGIDLITLEKYGGPEICVGAYVLDVSSAEGRSGPAAAKTETILARETILATGGAGKVYVYTTNPDVATGDGIAMAYRAGAECANMEFYQFHPTCLFHPQAKSFLISEALRGEGAILRNAVSGRAFMKDYDAREELAPRDIVARAIDHEMKRTGAEHVLLDITHKPESFVKERFPGIHAECKRWGIDIAKEPIPVVPAAHFCCGGVSTDLEGRTSIPGLWAIGECAHTGLHGANRLASNSLLEGLVFGHRAAEAMVKKDGERAVPEVPDWDVGEAGTSDEAVVITQNWDELRRLMWNYVGIVRTNKRLRRAARRIALLQEEIAEYYWSYFVTRDLLELRNIATVAELIVSCASARRESRGLHYTIDYPELDAKMARDTIVKRGVPAHLRVGPPLDSRRGLPHAGASKRT